MRAALTCFIAGLALSLAGCADRAQPEAGPLVLAASSMQEALEAGADAWAAEGHARPVLSFAATSALARQVEAGAPGDLFIAADAEWMDELEQAGLLAPGSRQVLAGNRLVLVAPAGESVMVDLASPLAPLLGDGRLAMADPEAVPAGRYGKQALSSLGRWDEVSGHVATAENVRAALALVSRGEARLGVVYRTDALAESGVQVAATFPEDTHTAIAYPVARLAMSTHPEAEGFEAFLLSPDGQAIFRRFGFGTH